MPPALQAVRGRLILGESYFFSVGPGVSYIGGGVMPLLWPQAGIEGFVCFPGGRIFAHAGAPAVRHQRPGGHHRRRGRPLLHLQRGGAGDFLSVGHEASVNADMIWTLMLTLSLTLVRAILEL